MATEFERLREILADTYRLERELGEGGMATVYLAQDLRHARLVAVKVLKMDVAATLGAERFLREITLTARLDHPHILPLLDSGNADGTLYYVMPFVDGESLRDRLNRERQLPLQDALAITSEIADALHYAHELGIIHRDIKPENILLAGGHARLADFGIARLATAATADHALTSAGVVVGTAVYMSPEQASGERELDRRSDIYSLAAVAYEMLAGEPPHVGRTAQAILARKLREPAPSLTIVRESVPQGVDDAIRKALDKVPADRFATAQQFAQALERSQAVPDLRSAIRSRSDRPQLPSGRLAHGAAGHTRLRARHLMLAAFVALFGAVVFWYLGRNRDTQWLAGEALPRIERYLDVADFESAYALAREIERRDPLRPELTELWPRISWRVTIPSEPSGARVFRQAYSDTTDTWEELGRTPLVDIRFPFGLSRLRFELDGHPPLLRALGGAHLHWAELTAVNADMLLVGPETYRIDTERTLPSGMVRVPGGSLVVGSDTIVMRDFMLGRYEVTNAEYKRFVDAGGYRRREFWDSVDTHGRPVNWEAAMRRFTDRTGRPGPSTWEAGDFPERQDAFPVAGVSVYEAAAYARFVGQELPTAHQWQWALANSMFPWLLPASNFGGEGPRPVTASRAMTHVGAFDMAGNVREWTASTIGDEQVILGGSWNDPYYIAGTSDASAPPGDRSSANGFRLAVTSDEPAVAAQLRAPITSRTTVSTAVHAQPIPDAVFDAYGRVFDYQHGPLNPMVERTDRSRLWTRERVQLDAGYGAERMLLYLYLPTTGAPPYQTVLYWPGWDAFALDDIDMYFAKQLDFLVKSGRAVAFPIYKGIFERRVGGARRRPDFNTAAYRDNAIDGVKDLRRSIDYLETRSEIDTAAMAFFGYSWGGVNGPLALAREPRLRTAIIEVGLLPPMPSTPEVDPVNALPRVRQPTLMLSGEFDPMVPVANAKRYFALLGAAPADKRHVIAIGGHFIPRNLLMREVLDWLDARLGQTSR